MDRWACCIALYVATHKFTGTRMCFEKVGMALCRSNVCALQNNVAYNSNRPCVEASFKHVNVGSFIYKHTKQDCAFHVLADTKVRLQKWAWLAKNICQHCCASIPCFFFKFCIACDSIWVRPK